MHYEVVCISDLHVGAYNCEHKRLNRFLHLLKDQEIKTDLLIIAGDGFDHLKAKKIKHKHWKIIKLIKKITKHTRVIWLLGNHDPDRDFILEHVEGVDIMDTYLFESGDKKVLVSHGHQHDDFLGNHPIITAIADGVYGFSQFIDPTHNIAKFLKRSSKSFIKCARKIGAGTALAAKDAGCDVAWHGHNHRAGHVNMFGIDVWDSGCWSEKPGSYLTIKNGFTSLHWFK